MKKQPWEIALQKFTDEWSSKKEVAGILVAGSFVTGNPSKHSDLDMNIVLKKGTKWRERGNKVIDGFLFEYFANPPEQVIEYFEKDHQNNRRTTAHMYASGKVLIEKDESLTKLRTLAIKYLATQYEPMSDFALQTTKYLLWDSMDNLEEIFEAKTANYNYVYYTHLDKLFSQYAVYVGYSEVKPHKIHSFLTDKKALKKYDMPAFPDKIFVKRWLACMTVSAKDDKQKQVKKLTQYVLQKMGGFDVDGFTFRSKLIKINLKKDEKSKNVDAVAQINELIAELPSMKEANEVFDGYHTFGEVYHHRVTLYLVLCKFLQKQGYHVWRSKLHDDNSFIEGFFVLGLNTKEGEQITYHIRNQHWDSTSFADTLDVAPKFDGHTSQDVVARLFNIFETEKSNKTS
jgi:hypothetical protein